MFSDSFLRLIGGSGFCKKLSAEADCLRNLRQIRILSVFLCLYLYTCESTSAWMKTWVLMTIFAVFRGVSWTWEGWLFFQQLWQPTSNSSEELESPGSHCHVVQEAEPHCLTPGCMVSWWTNDSETILLLPWAENASEISSSAGYKGMAPRLKDLQLLVEWRPLQ